MRGSVQGRAMAIAREREHYRVGCTLSDSNVGLLSFPKGWEANLKRVLKGQAPQPVPQEQLHGTAVTVDYGVLHNHLAIIVSTYANKRAKLCVMATFSGCLLLCVLQCHLSSCALPTTVAC